MGIIKTKKDMKFVLALLGAINAAEVVVPEISWNQTAVAEAGQTVEQWAHKAETDKKADDQIMVNDLVNAYSRYRVGEYVSFGKNMKPLAQQYEEMVDILTPAGTCNREVAVECANDFFQHRTTKGEMEQCVYNKAQCHTQWEQLTPEQKQA